MRISRLRIESNSALPPMRSLGERLQTRLRGEDVALSVDGLDASIRTLAVVTGLVLSLLGYGRINESPLGIAADPVLISIGLVAYNLVIVAFLGVPWRNPPGFFLFLLDWLVVSAAVLLTGGFFSPFLILYYALIIGAALRVGLSRSLLLVGACAMIYAALTTARPTPAEAIHLPALVVGVTSLLMVAVTAVFMKRAVEVEERKVEDEERTAGQLRLLNNLTRVVLSGSPNLESVMRTVASVSSQALEADSGLVVLFENAPSPHTESGEMDGIRSQLIVSDKDPSPIGLSPSEARVAGDAVRTQAPVLIEDMQVDSRYGVADRFPGLERAGSRVKTVACVPLLLSGGGIGVLFVGRFGQRSFGEAEVNLLTAIGQQMAVAVRLARLYEMERERASRSEERERLERDLLSMVSHELRTPLTSIKTSVGALESIEGAGGHQAGKESTESRLLHNIERSTDRLITLVNELLDMARLRAGRVSLNLQQLNMGDVILEMAAHVRPLMEARGQSLALDLPVAGSPRWEMLKVLADRRRIEQVVLNLLSNANKYAPEGGKITLGATPRDGNVKVFVRDDGPGIEPVEQRRIFEKFYRTAGHPGLADSKPDGSGLGLAIARSIIELHGGQIGVQSRPGRGSTFFFVLAEEG